MASNKNDGDVDVGLGQGTLKFESAQIRQPHIENQACRRLGALAAEKLARRPEWLDPQAYRREKLLNGVTDRRVVINHKYNRIGVRHDAVSRSAGSVNLRLAPWSRCG